LSIGNSQEEESESTAGGLGAGFDLGWVCACARFGSMVMPRKNSSSEICVLIEIAKPLL
jgi:hypothetical protein